MAERKRGGVPKVRVVQTGAALEAMRAAWERRGAELLAGPTLPTRAAVYDAAVSVVLEGLEAQGASITEIAELCDTSRRAVRSMLRRLGLYRGRPVLSATEAADALGVEVRRG